MYILIYVKYLHWAWHTSLGAVSGWGYKDDLESHNLVGVLHKYMGNDKVL